MNNIHSIDDRTLAETMDNHPMTFREAAFLQAYMWIVGTCSYEDIGEITTAAGVISERIIKAYLDHESRRDQRHAGVAESHGSSGQSARPAHSSSEAPQECLQEVAQLSQSSESPVVGFDTATVSEGGGGVKLSPEAV